MTGDAANTLETNVQAHFLKTVDSLSNIHAVDVGYARRCLRLGTKHLGVGTASKELHVVDARLARGIIEGGYFLIGSLARRLALGF